MSKNFSSPDFSIRVPKTTKTPQTKNENGAQSITSGSGPTTMQIEFSNGDGRSQGHLHVCICLGGLAKRPHAALCLAALRLHKRVMQSSDATQWMWGVPHTAAVRLIRPHAQHGVLLLSWDALPPHF
mmetsp:Transcript_69802/g.111719  ORF Transcript_69802/g.111719 Transcript_69802/m.111719 type:complete len:127 (+) Transcript_69802:314-694(+)|eukprot:CAMPEP_0174382556 /NCGR_PEP_ID=MMETSP0811_2-20130205/124668_1 /TAXON_ID=73025 ORGANISM="Eutreptiella gymnastica-like, Strain CCMP1594" /NCGR_SAMPLE_ID=MMETSP0811_2 /ASSEMBLY_ACC=CAM_ASM_000667 /LENGTH=126 /DNA_ID=CAMNT_0015535895 /DNA_START=656 /DNA_END=1036 /DNA_ORIENTATION=+